MSYEHYLHHSMMFGDSLYCYLLVFFYIWHTSIISANALSSTNRPDYSSRKVLRVCTSPGCKDDGAASTFDCLSAMAPPGIEIVRGSCVSLCGAGPVVEVCCGDAVNDTALSIKKKRVKGSEAILILLDECVAADMNGGNEALKPHLRDRLLRGYELSLKANEAYKSKSYQLAVDLYTEAIESGRKPAMMLHEARIKLRIDVAGVDDNEDHMMQWLVTSFKNSCRSQLLLRNVDEARRNAFAATVFSRCLDADAHECLAEVCAASSDVIGEIQSLKASIEQYCRMEEEYSKLANGGADATTRAEAAKRSRQASTRKRELGFRITRLERLMGF